MASKKYKAEFKIRMVKEYLERRESDPKLTKADFAFEKEIGEIALALLLFRLDAFSLFDCLLSHPIFLAEAPFFRERSSFWFIICPCRKYRFSISASLI